MSMVIHKAESRGHANHGWLDTYHTFSFGMYHEPSRMHFGMLRVLNDDLVIGGEGFGKHGHDNMEIISTPLKGSLAHTDSTGNEGIISTGDVQIMSAGTGIMHAEYNASETEPVNFLQLWIFPKERNIEPRYDQMRFEQAEIANQFRPIVSNEEGIEALRINQDARLLLGEFDVAMTLTHTMSTKSHGIYVFVIEGKVTVSGQELHRRDGMGIQDEESVLMNIASQSTILLIEVPV